MVVITNQRGIARDRLSVDTLREIHARVDTLIDLEAGAYLDAYFYCPHEIGTCSCRKPEVGMFLQALERWPDIDLGRSAMVGDSLIDIEAGQALGMTSIRLGVDAPDLLSAVDHLLDESV